MSQPQSSSRTVSIVLATYNRGAGLKLLLQDFAAQDVPAASFEVVVIDDGSKEPAAQALAGYVPPYALHLKRQANQGAARARDAGVRMATGEVIIITDDDMRVGPDFVRQHRQAHERGATVVLGHIAASHQLAAMPVFERFHAQQLARFVAGVRSGKIKPRGVHVCTGNVSFRRADYLALGGFDATLQRSEDRELGVRLEQAGAKLAFCLEAVTTHESDHADAQVWLKRAFLYGVYDRKIARKHQQVEMADPWRFFFLVSPISRPWLLGAVLAPGPMGQLTKWVMRAAGSADAHGLEAPALAATTLAYGLEYFRGMRNDAGSLQQAGSDFVGYLRKRRQG